MRECHADCYITLLLDLKSAESTKEEGGVRSDGKSRFGRETGLACRCGVSAMRWALKEGNCKRFISILSQIEIGNLAVWFHALYIWMSVST